MRGDALRVSFIILFTSGEYKRDMQATNAQTPHRGATHLICGDPISHSLSPAIYNALYEHHGMDCRCATIRVNAGELRAFLRNCTHTQISRLNLTHPLKRAAIPLLDALSETARKAESVNTVALRGGKWIGTSTDGAGFARSLAEAGLTLAGQHALILGAGGAAEALAFQSKADGAASIAIAARRPDRAAKLAAKVGGVATAWGDLSQIAKNSTLLIQATPLGMRGNGRDFDDLSFVEALPDHAAVCDIVYAPRETNLLRAARDRGLCTVGGLGMLVGQALEAFTFFTGVETGAGERALVEARLSDNDTQKLREV